MIRSTIPFHSFQSEHRQTSLFCLDWSWAWSQDSGMEHVMGYEVLQFRPDHRALPHHHHHDPHHHHHQPPPLHTAAQLRLFLFTLWSHWLALTLASSRAHQWDKWQMCALCCLGCFWGHEQSDSGKLYGEEYHDYCGLRVDITSREDCADNSYIILQSSFLHLVLHTNNTGRNTRIY